MYFMLPRRLSVGRTRASAAALFALAALIPLLNGCSREAPAPKAELPRPVRIQTVGDATAPAVALSTLNLPGEIRARVESRLGFQVPGKLAQRLVKTGDPVSAGQVLARLDPQDAAPALAGAQAQLEAARTDLKLAQTELRRIQELVEKNFVSKAQLDRQQASVDAALSRQQAAEAQVRQARNGVDFQTLVADSAGIITGVEAEVGQVLGAGTPVYRLARNNERELLINVPETELAAARGVQRWKVLMPALGNRALEGQLRELTPLADAASRTYPMRITLKGDLAGVEMGMTAYAVAPRPDGAQISAAVALPIGAIFGTDKQPGVWVVGADNTVKLVPVEIGGMNEELVYVKAGLSSGQKVVTAGANLLKAGQQVRIEGASSLKAGGR